MYHGNSLKELNVQNCGITGQGTRSMISAFNINTSLKYFNFAHNELKSPTYEFSIKLGASLVRHPVLNHLDLTNTGLVKEEVLYMGVALGNSHTVMSLHLSGNQLSYYERIFLRSVTAAKVGYSSKMPGNPWEPISSNNEYNNVLGIVAGGANPQLQNYTRIFNALDLEAQGLDFELAEMIDDLKENECFDSSLYQKLEDDELELKPIV
jgi:Leucine-rich repeat (LRR) protein